MTKNYLVQKVSDAEVEKPCFRTESLIFGGITATFASPSINARVHTWNSRSSSSISLGEGNGTPLQYSCLENPMDGGAW